MANKGIIFVPINHCVQHENAVQIPSLSPAVITQIQGHARKGYAPFQIRAVFQNKGDELPWSQIYNRWIEFTKEKFHRNRDPFLSCKLYVDSCKYMDLCFFFSFPRAIGFTTSISRSLSEQHECAEALIDSVWKTNSSKLELFLY